MMTREIKQYPLLAEDSPEVLALKTLSWRLCRLRWVFWCYQAMVVGLSAWVSFDAWDHVLMAQGLPFIDFLSLGLMIISVATVAKHRIFIDRRLKQSVLVLWQQQEPKPGLFAPSGLGLEDDANTAGFGVALLMSLFFMLLNGIVFLFGFNNAFFGAGYWPVTWSLMFLFAIGTVADLLFSVHLETLKAEARGSYQAVRRRRYAVGQS